MGGIRSNSTGWPADHTIVIFYRWLSWGLAAFLLMIWPTSEHGWVLLGTAGLNIALMLFVRPLLALLPRHPALVGIDLLASVLVIWLSGNWDSAFFLYACAALIAPALLFGWRGGVMAGLSLVTLTLLVFWAAGHPAEGLINAGAWSTLALVMVTPPLFGGLLPAAVQRLRDTLSPYVHPSGSAAPRPNLPTGSTKSAPLSGGFLARSPELKLQFPLVASDTSVIAHAIHTDTAATSVEDLRRAIFAPLDADVTELPLAIDILATRFQQSTNTDTRVVLLGRARTMCSPHRELLVRLAQEALLNIQQHAHASTVVLTLHYDATSVVLLVQDNGVGLLDGTHERPGMHALRAMSYRMTEFGGRLHVFDVDGNGVTVRATMPLV